MTSQLKFPAFRDKHPLTVEIDSELLKAVKEVAKERRLTLREIVEHGFKLFLDAIKKE